MLHQVPLEIKQYQIMEHTVCKTMDVRVYGGVSTETLKGLVINSASTDDLTSPGYFQADFDIAKEAKSQDFYVKFSEV